MQELIKIVGLLPVKNGKSELYVISSVGDQFKLVADPKAETNELGIVEFAIVSPTLKKLGIKANETAYLVPSDGEAGYELEYTAPAKKVAAESVSTGRGATPNFSIQR